MWSSKYQLMTGGCGGGGEGGGRWSFGGVEWGVKRERLRYEKGEMSEVGRNVGNCDVEASKGCEGE